MNDSAVPSSNCGPVERPKLLDRVRHAMRLRRYSRRTEEAYVSWIRRYVGFHRKRHPADMGAADVSRFLSWLATARQVSASTLNQALGALLFLYRVTLGQDIGQLDHLVRAKVPERLPVVLSRDEVAAVCGSFRVSRGSCRRSSTVRG